MAWLTPLFWLNMAGEITFNNIMYTTYKETDKIALRKEIAKDIERRMKNGEPVAESEREWLGVVKFFRLDESCKLGFKPWPADV